MEGLLSFLRGGQAQVPGSTQQPSGLGMLLQPEVGLKIAGQLLGQQGNQQNFANAFSTGADAFGQQKELQAQTAKENQTWNWLEQNAPEIAQYRGAGWDAKSALDLFVKEKYAQKAAGPAAVQEYEYAKANGFQGSFMDYKGAQQSGGGLINAGDGNLYDQENKTWLRAPGNGGDGQFRFNGNSVEAQSLNGLIESGQLTPEQAQQLGAGKTITNPADGSVMFMTPQGVFGQSQQGGAPQPIGGQGSQEAAPGAGVQPPPGMIPLTPAKPTRPPTDAERRNIQLYSVVEPELKVVEDNFDALTGLGNQAAATMPFGADYMTTPQYQKATNSLQTIVASYLYSISGANANPGEVQKQTAILTPRPGESSASIAQKKARVRTMVESIKMGRGQGAPQDGGGVIQWNDPNW